MSVEFELEEDGRIRVKVDRKGERAVSDVMDPLEMMHEIAEAAGWDGGVEGNEFVVALPEELSDPGDPNETEGNGDTTQEVPDEPTEEVPGEPGIDESAPPEEETGNGDPENPDDGTGQDMTDDIPPSESEPNPEEPSA